MDAMLPATEAQLKQALELHRTGHLDEAQELYLQVHASGYKRNDTLHLLGVIAMQKGDVANASSLIGESLKLDAAHPAALANMGVVLFEQRRYEESLASCERALELDPMFSEAHNGKGVALRLLLRHEESLKVFERAIQLRPTFVDAMVNLAVTLRELDRHAEAMAWFSRALAIDPSHVEGNLGEALCRLQMGDFMQGWPQYEWRWKKQINRPWRQDFGRPLWFGNEPLSGRTILLYHEQGFGDTIQFARYVPLVAAVGARVILALPEPLLSLFADYEGVSAIISNGDALPLFDLQCPLMSLPLAFQTRLETIPAPIQYLYSNPSKVAAWSERLGAKNRPRIGIVWSGRVEHGNDNNRSIRLADVLSLMVDQFEFVSLQKEVREADSDILEASTLKHFGNDLCDFSDTAALLESMDLVISIDTSIAHLAGAMGKPVWILLPFNADWRWLSGRKDSPWYPSARLFQQKQLGCLEGCI